MMEWRFWRWKVLRQNQYIASTAAGLTVVYLVPLINRLVPEQAALKQYTSYGAEVVERFWREIALVFLAVAIANLYRRVAVHRHPGPYENLGNFRRLPPFPIGLHPIEILLMTRMRDAGGGPFESGQIEEMLGPTKEHRIGSLGVTLWVHLRNLIVLKFVSVKTVDSSEVVSDLSDLFVAAAQGREPRQVEQKSTRGLFSLTMLGQEVLGDLEDVRPELSTDLLEEVTKGKG